MLVLLCARRAGWYKFLDILKWRALATFLHIRISSWLVLLGADRIQALVCNVLEQVRALLNESLPRTCCGCRSVTLTTLVSLVLLGWHLSHVVVHSMLTQWN